MEQRDVNKKEGLSGNEYVDGFGKKILCSDQYRETDLER